MAISEYNAKGKGTSSKKTGLIGAFPPPFGRCRTSSKASAAMFAGDVSRVEEHVWGGTLEGTSVVLKPRTRRPNEDVDHDAIEIYIKVRRKMPFASELSRNEGWNVEHSYCMWRRDTWIDSRAENAQKLMNAMAVAVTVYLEKEAPPYNFNPVPFIIKSNEALDRMERILLTLQARYLAISNPGRKLGGESITFMKILDGAKQIFQDEKSLQNASDGESVKRTNTAMENMERHLLSDPDRFLLDSDAGRRLYDECGRNY